MESQCSESNDVNEATSHKSFETLSEQVSFDLTEKLSQFRDCKKGLNSMARSMQIHKKTLNRLIKQENRPGYLTLLKIYRYLYSCANDSELLTRVPENIREALIKGNPQRFEKEVNYYCSIDTELLNDKVFCEIYVLCATGEVSRQLIEYRFGQYGLKKVEKMLKLGVLQVCSEDFYSLGRNRANIGAETIKEIGLHIVDQYGSVENFDERGNNYMAFYAEGLSKQTYNEWLKIDEESYYKKVELANRAGSRGEIRAFTFISTDTLIRN